MVYVIGNHRIHFRISTPRRHSYTYQALIETLAPMDCYRQDLKAAVLYSTVRDCGPHGIRYVISKQSTTIISGITLVLGPRTRM